MNTFLIVIISIINVLALLDILSLIFYHRFFFTSVIAFYIKHFRYTPFRKSYEECKKLINVPHEEYEVPSKLKFNCSFSKKKEAGMNVYYLNEETDNNNTVFVYFHGGGFYNNFDKHHWVMLNKIVKRTGVMIIAPDYPLIPDVRCDDLYPLLVNFYRYIKNKYPDKRITIGGDSAGGGISLVLGELLNKEEQPDEIILLSPAIDMNIPKEDEKSFKKCIFIGKKAWPAIAEMWIGKNMSTDNILVSPINGNLSKIKHMTFFYGDREFCYNSIERLKAKTTENENINYRLYKGMYHVWVATPVLEARKALKEICKILN